MRKLNLVLWILGISALFVTAVNAQESARALTVEDMWAMARVGNPTLSPDGNWIAFTVTRYSMEENRSNSDIYLVNTASAEIRRLTTFSGYDGSPVWTPDGKALTFLSSRSGSVQIWRIPLAGGEATQFSHVPTDIADFCWSPDGSHLLVVTSVYPDATSLEHSAQMDEERQASKVKAQIIDHLLFRHWNHWRNGKYSHLYLMSSDGKILRDLTPGAVDCPPIDLGSAHDFTFSPDGKEIAFVKNDDPVVAISTNNDIFLTSPTGDQVKKLTTSPANDNQPVYSPDGRYLAYHAMKRPGFEADQYDLILYDRQNGSFVNMTEGFDLDVDEMIWSPKSDYVYFTSRNQGRVSIFRIQVKSKKIEELVHEHVNHHLMIDPKGKMLYFCQEASNRPAELFAFDLNKKSLRPLTHFNAERLAGIKMNDLEDFWFESFDGRKVHGFLLKPPFFSPDKKYPLVFLIHGGPQGMWSDNFHYRWNSQMFAAPGYVVVMINFRGSKGYGQWFCDQVTKDWGGGPYKDLMVGLEYVLAKYDFIDENKLAAAGASYGGFMINWIAGQAHTSPANKFKCLVSHDGVFDQISMYGGTEELWFPEWEFGGTPYEHPELYEKWSPSRYVKNFKIPTLVIHGENDFRVPITQGLQMFTALQRMGVPSKLLYFPDEDHFVTKPQNARLWWQTVLGWIEQWIQ